MLASHWPMSNVTRSLIGPFSASSHAEITVRTRMDAGNGQVLRFTCFIFSLSDIIIGTQSPTLPLLSTAISSANVPLRYIHLY